MSGFNTNSFVDLPQSLQKHLICSICLNLYNKAVKTDCGHTFCKKCLKRLIESNQNFQKKCPICRADITTRKRNKMKTTDSNSVIISGFVFSYDLVANNIVNEVKAISSENWLCPNCELFERSEGQECSRLCMKTAINQLKAKNSSLEKEVEILKTNVKELTQSLNQIKDKKKRQRNTKNLLEAIKTISEQNRQKKFSSEEIVEISYQFEIPFDTRDDIFIAINKLNQKDFLRQTSKSKYKLMD